MKKWKIIKYPLNLVVITWSALPYYSNWFSCHSCLYSLCLFAQLRCIKNSIGVFLIFTLLLKSGIYDIPEISIRIYFFFVLLLLFSWNYHITGFFWGMLFLQNSVVVSTAKYSIAKNILNIARKMSTCGAPLSGTCRFWILTLCLKKNRIAMVLNRKKKSQKLFVPNFGTNRKNLHPQKKTVIRYKILKWLSIFFMHHLFAALLFTSETIKVLVYFDRTVFLLGGCHKKLCFIGHRCMTTYM